MPRLKEPKPACRPHSMSSMNRKSMQPRGASASKRMRSTESSAFVPVVHRLANAVGAPPERTRASGNCRRYARENAPIEKRSEEHTSELQSPCNLVCRLLLEKKKKNIK